jgi:adenylate cyclase
LPGTRPSDSNDLMLDLVNWILEEGLRSDDLGAIFKGLAERLVARGIPLVRVTLGMPTIDPKAAVVNFRWSRAEGLTGAELTHEYSADITFQQSPLRYLRDRYRTEGIPAERWNLEDPEVVRRFPLFKELRAMGATEYALRLVVFEEGRTALQGVMLSAATDRPGGFGEAEFREIGRILPALAITAFRIALSRVATETLGAYLGPQTGAQVLQGKIRRGDSEVISAALLLADLRGFTALADRAPGTEVVAWLNQHLERIGDAVTAAGGEILKFLGDGLLAVFASAEMGAEEACRRALGAALEAQSGNAALNQERRDKGEPALDLSIALHFGDVVYGNIGTARRLDFTVIGAAVNEVSRMEALGKSLGRPLLLSESIAHRCGRAVVSLGVHELRGITGAREMYVVAP